MKIFLLACFGFPFHELQLFFCNGIKIHKLLSKINDHLEIFNYIVRLYDETYLSNVNEKKRTFSYNK
jgi:hypothetical protein